MLYQHERNTDMLSHLKVLQLYSVELIVENIFIEHGRYKNCGSVNNFTETEESDDDEDGKEHKKSKSVMLDVGRKKKSKSLLNTKKKSKSSKSLDKGLNKKKGSSKSLIKEKKKGSSSSKSLIKEKKKGSSSSKSLNTDKKKGKASRTSSSKSLDSKRKLKKGRSKSSTKSLDKLSKLKKKSAKDLIFNSDLELKAAEERMWRRRKKKLYPKKPEIKGLLPPFRISISMFHMKDLKVDQVDLEKLYPPEDDIPILSSQELVEGVTAPRSTLQRQSRPAHKTLSKRISRSVSKTGKKSKTVSRSKSLTKSKSKSKSKVKAGTKAKLKSKAGSKSKSPKSRSKSRESRSKSPKSRSKSRESRSKSRESRSKSRESRSKSRESRSKSRESRSKSRESRSKSRESRSKSRESRSKSRESRSKSRESRSKSRESRSKSRKSRSKSRHSSKSLPKSSTKSRSSSSRASSKMSKNIIQTKKSKLQGVDGDELRDALVKLAQDSEQDPTALSKYREIVGEQGVKCTKDPFQTRKAARRLRRSEKEKREQIIISLRTVTDFKRGLSMFFAMTPLDLMNRIMLQKIEIEVQRSDVKGPPFDVGKVKIKLPNQIRDKIQDSASSTINKPLWASLEDRYPVIDYRGRNVGSIDVYFCLTCLGNGMVSRSLVSETSLYEYSNVAKLIPVARKSDKAENDRAIAFRTNYGNLQQLTHRNFEKDKKDLTIDEIVNLTLGISSQKKY